MDVSAKITGIKYSPLLCRELKTYEMEQLAEALAKDGTFILDIDSRNRLALSWWVSAKRTRSYPYARVYDSLIFQGKKVTIIPVYKDEGKDGDRDFLQWDTVSLMSLFDVYTIIAYYSCAEQSPKYKNKITKQRFDLEFIIEEINNLLSYRSSALHWNIAQIGKIGEIAQKAFDAYSRISDKLGVEMHSIDSAKKRIQKLQEGRESFMIFSRELARQAQSREEVTIQPKEKLSAKKAKLTIENYLGGYYFFTCDEVVIDEGYIHLIEAKHSKREFLPSKSDIKDGLFKMILFTNLKDVKIGEKELTPVPVLKLTSDLKFVRDGLRESQVKMLLLLKREAKDNLFRVLVNNLNLEEIEI